jgi:hypothetical protein
MNKAKTPKDLAHDKTKELLDPILDLFGGADGGVASSKLRHQLLPHFIEQNMSSGSHEAFITMVTQFSTLCRMTLDKKI